MTLESDTLMNLFELAGKDQHSRRIQSRSHPSSMANQVTSYPKVAKVIALRRGTNLVCQEASRRSPYKAKVGRSLDLGPARIAELPQFSSSMMPMGLYRV